MKRIQVFESEDGEIHRREIDAALADYNHALLQDLRTFFEEHTLADEMLTGHNAADTLGENWEQFIPVYENIMRLKCRVSRLRGVTEKPEGRCPDHCEDNCHRCPHW